MPTPVAVSGVSETAAHLGLPAGTVVTATLSQPGFTTNGSVVNRLPVTVYTSDALGTYSFSGANALYKNSDIFPTGSYYTINEGGVNSIAPVIVTGAGVVRDMVLQGLPPSIGLKGGDVVLQTIAPATGTINLDHSVYGAFKLTLGGNVTITLSGATNGQQSSYDVWAFQPTTGGTYNYSITWPNSVVWPGGVPPSMPAGAGASLYANLVSLDGGITYLGSGGTPKNTVSRALVLAPANQSVANSDGVTWVDLPGGPVLIIIPTANCNALITGSVGQMVDTVSGTVSPQTGLYVVGGIYPSVAGVPEVFQQTGGQVVFNPEFVSPSTVIPLIGGTTYTVNFRTKASANNATHTLYYGPQYSEEIITAALFY